ncbi:MAG: 1,4-alpha-glucan branching enzyme, partial [Polyangia bacterium]|nr:1,4-alpha-glucan branching enzyme [Polyangia bacterium]
MTKATEPFFGELDQHLFNRGTHYRLYDKLGAHPITRDGAAGTHFAVWAPNAERVSVIGDFNDWNDAKNPMATVGETGVWATFLPGVGVNAIYKYVIWSREGGLRAEKADPVGFAAELRPRSASKVCDLDGYAWGDGDW